MKQREIKFRAITEYGDTVYGHYMQTAGRAYIIEEVNQFRDIQDPDFEHAFTEVDPRTASQFTGATDKNGKDIYEGDILQYRIPYRDTQTHYGDNIPRGEYTEPMEPAIKEMRGEVKFIDGAFMVANEDWYRELWHRVISSEECERWNLEDIKEAISWGNMYEVYEDMFDDPEEGDLQYLIKECAEVNNAEELIEYLSGIEIIGNIYENPELIDEEYEV